MSNITSLIRIFSHKHHLVSLFTFANPTVVESFKAPISFLLRASAICHSIIREKKKKKQSFLKPKEATLIKLISRAFLMPCPVCMQSRKEKKKGEFGGITITCLCIHRHADVMHKWVKFKECCH
jgi:hypothetical protein